MSRQRSVILTLIVALLAGGLVAIFATTISPLQADGAPDLPVVAAFLAALTVLIGALVTLVTLAVHARWPALGGAVRGAANPAVAVRQGMLVAVACAICLILALLGSLDVAFVLVIVLLIGLVETYIQVRG